MKKSLIFKILLTNALILAGSCSVASPVKRSVDCNQAYNEIVNQIKNKSGKPKAVNPYNNDLAVSISKLLPACPKHVGLRVLMADVQVSLGKNITALGYITEALHIDPDNADAIHVKGILLSLEGKVEESLTLLKRSLDLEPDNIDFLVNYCSTLESFAQYEETIEACSKAAQFDNAPPVVFYIRGRDYEATGYKKNAQQDYDKARELGFDMWPKKQN